MIKTKMLRLNKDIYNIQIRRHAFWEINIYLASVDYFMANALELHLSCTNLSICGITRPQWINVITWNDDKTWSPTKKESAQFLPVHTNTSIISIFKRISRVGIMFCKSYFKHAGNKNHGHNIKEHPGMLFPILFNTHMQEQNFANNIFKCRNEQWPMGPCHHWFR